jgi:hypothetical protein
MTTRNIITIPYMQTVKPLGKVSIEYLPDGCKQIKAYFLGEHIRTGTQTGIAIEGSFLMKPAFGYKGKIGDLFVQQTGPNLVSMAAQKMGSYLARKVDEDGNTTFIYWATGFGGIDIETVGELTAYQIEQHNFNGPKEFGTMVKLLPAIRYFVEQFTSAGWGMYVFFTQGVIDDLEDVKEYSIRLAEEIVAGRRNELKLVLVGVGRKVDKSHLEQLDCLDREAAVDLWDYRIAVEMKDVLEIFTELGDKNTIIAPKGRVFDPSGQIVADYTNKGVPALMMFTLPEGAKSFMVELPEGSITQPVP